jgi:hypothetical protein
VRCATAVSAVRTVERPNTAETAVPHSKNVAIEPQWIAT